MKLILINSNNETSFVASYISGKTNVKYTSEFLDNSQNAYLKSPDKLIHCLKYISDSIISSGIKLSEIDAVSVITGPGSFTGIRVGLALAKGFASTLGKKIIPVDNFELISVQCKEHLTENYCIFVPSKKPEFYYKLYENHVEKESGCIQIDDFKAKFDKSTMLVGNFSDEYQEKLGYFNILNGKNFKPEPDSMIEIAVSKYKEGQICEPDKAVPLYMKDFEFKKA